MCVYVHIYIHRVKPLIAVFFTPFQESEFYTTNGSRFPVYDYSGCRTARAAAAVRGQCQRLKLSGGTRMPISDATLQVSNLSLLLLINKYHYYCCYC